MPLVARFAGNPILYLVLAIFLCVLGSIAVVAIAAKRKSGVALLGWPLVVAPLVLWMYECKSDHALFRAQLVEHGARGKLSIYGEEPSDITINNRRVIDKLAMLQPESGEPRKIRFHDFFALSCEAGELNHALVTNEVYAVRFDPDDPDHFCVEQTADAIARDAECPALARQIQEQAARVRLAPADAAAQRELPALQAQYDARCTDARP